MGSLITRDLFPPKPESQHSTLYAEDKLVVSQSTLLYFIELEIIAPQLLSLVRESLRIDLRANSLSKACILTFVSTARLIYPSAGGML